MSVHFYDSSKNIQVTSFLSRLEPTQYEKLIDKGEVPDPTGSDRFYVVINTISSIATLAFFFTFVAFIGYQLIFNTRAALTSNDPKIVMPFIAMLIGVYISVTIFLNTETSAAQIKFLRQLKEQLNQTPQPDTLQTIAGFWESCAQPF